ncbi:MAG TPA: NADH-quinone oxidoreductase subunit J [Alphaproteobacteria bacterium]|nr:NADH:ubiquinone oxidoreductase subunit J [Paracoccaceae bacterium]RPH14395.1 MAG: NADH-quinone oxidoreductase subunit J [Alphaproteobacteria bacterium TMED150]HCY47601.1 NADH-quinone oxidoreductase subunit J [Alphaproteobacteria bacterium]
MMYASIAFYIIAFITLLSAFLVVSARNPVHSVLFLILTFFSSAGLFLLLGAEFLAMILMVVYVGAVAVLFLFVVMMLDVDFAELRQGFLSYLPLGGLIALALVAEILVAIVGRELGSGSSLINQQDAANTQLIGQVLYTDHVLLFQLSGLILLVAMIGAIVLTLRHRDGVRRQNIASQVGRRAEDAVELKDVEPGRGISR